MKNNSEIRPTVFVQGADFERKFDYSVVGEITPDMYSKETIVKAFSMLTVHPKSSNSDQT